MNDRPGNELEQGTLFLELAREISSTLELQAVLDKSFAALGQLISFDGGAIQLIHEGHLVPAAAMPALSDEAKTVRIPIGAGISGKIAETGEPIYIPDITVDDRVSPAARSKGTSGGVRSYFGAPLILYGDPIGVFQIDSKEVDAFGQGDRDSVLRFLPTVSAAVRNALLFDQEREAVEKLQEAERIKSRFMQIVSHELRTPLAVVLGFSETLADQAPKLDTDTIIEIAGRTHSAARRLERLITDLVGVSQAERGRLTIEVMPTAAENVIEQAAFEARDSGTHEIVVDIPHALPDIHVDKDRAVQMLNNLLENAKKFSEPGSRITISASPAGTHVSVSVADQGRGISERDLNKIFDPFFQVDQSTTRTVGGLGIGLYLVRQIGAAMNAEVEARSTVGEGSEFTVRFRVAEEEEASA